MSNINFGFISELEGGATCIGYVPDVKHSNSGVTIATGFDIGQRSRHELRDLLPEKLAIKLRVFCQLTGTEAQAALESNPLVITGQEAKIIDNLVKQDLVELLQRRYRKSSERLEFSDLPEQAQTVIASVAFQYGNLAKRCPAFWSFATTQNWLAMVNELHNFGDRYNTRRTKEADYFLSGLIGNGR
jgi:hypothetical protein